MVLEKDLEILKNLEKLFMLKEVDLIALKDIDPSELGIEFTYKKRGTKFRAPLHIAKKLVREGYATVPEDYINWLKKMIWKEKSRTSQDILVRHEDSFYERLIIISEALKHDTSFNLDDEYRIQMIHVIGQTLAKRLEVILKKSILHTKEIMDFTAPEESLLLRIISEIIDMWREKLGVEFHLK